MKKEICPLLMLETNRESILQLGMNNKLHIEDDSTIALKSYQHVYILSNTQEIKDGDWYVRLFDNTICKANSQSDHKVYDCKKIVMSSDSNLITGWTNIAYEDTFSALRHLHWEYVPTLSENSLESIVKAYNSGNPITEVTLLESGTTKIVGVELEEDKQFKYTSAELKALLWKAHVLGFKRGLKVEADAHRDNELPESFKINFGEWIDDYINTNIADE